MKKTALSIIMLASLGFSIQAQTAKQTAFGMPNKVTKQNQVSPLRSINSIEYNPGREVEYRWDTVSGVWSFQDSIRNIYNSMGKVTLTLRYYGNQTYPSKTIYVYNTNGNVTSDTSKYWSGTAYYSSILTIYTYDVNNNLTQELHKNWDINTNTWVDSYRRLQTWSSGQLIEIINQSWNTSSNAFVSSYKESYLYTSGTLSGVTGYSWNGTGWDIDAKYVSVVWYQWTGNLDESLISSFVEQVQNGSVWKDTIKYSFTYDSFGNQTNMLEQSKPVNTYITTWEQKNSYLYDSNNNVTQDIEQNRANATVGFRNVYKREYGDYQLFIGIDELNKGETINVYPNPFSAKTVIAFKEDIKNGILKIIDISGKEIKTAAFTGRELTIERGEMKEGIYFVQIIESNKKVVTKKIVIQ